MGLNLGLSSKIRQTCSIKLSSRPSSRLDNPLNLNTSLNTSHSSDLRHTRSSKLRKIPRRKHINSLDLGLRLSNKLSIRLSNTQRTRLSSTLRTRLSNTLRTRLSNKFSTNFRVHLRNSHLQTNMTSFKNTIEAPNQHQARAQSSPGPQEDRAQPPLQQYQYRDASNEKQYVRPSDINPHVSYYQPSSTSRPYSHPAPVRSPLPEQRPTPSPTLAQPSPATSQGPVEAKSRPPTGSSSQNSYTSIASQYAGQQSPSMASSQPPQPAPSAQRNSTPATTNQQVSDSRPKTPSRAPSQAQTSSKQPEPSRRGSFLEDTTIGSISPQKDPYTSASRSTLGPRGTSTSSTSTAANAASAPARPKKSPAVSHAHPSPKPRAKAAKPAPAPVPASASPSVSAPAQGPTSGSPVMNTNSAAPATDTARPSIAASATSAGSQGPAVPFVLNAIPPALRAYATPQMLKTYTAPQKLRHTAPSQTSAQTSLSTSTSASPVTSKPTAPAPSQTPKPTVPPQTSPPTARGSLASAPPVKWKPTAPAVQQTTRATVPQTSAPTARSIPSSASPMYSKPTGPAISRMSKTPTSSQSPATSTARSISAPSAPPTDPRSAMTTEQQAPKVTAPSQGSAPISRGTVARASSIHSKPTGPAVPFSRVSLSGPVARSGSTSSAPPAESTSTLTAGPQMPRTTNPPQNPALLSRSASASSVSSVNSTPAMHAAPQMNKATISSQTGAQTTRSTFSSLAPPDNFTPFVRTSTPPTTTSEVASRPAGAPSASTVGGISSLPSQARLAEPQRKRSRPRLYPEVVNPVDQTAGHQGAGQRWEVHSQLNPPPNARPGQYRPAFSGLPSLPNAGTASPPPLSWSLHPSVVNRFQPSLSQSAAASRTPSAGLPPPAGHQPARVYAPQPRLAPNVGRLTTASAFGPVQPRHAPTQPQPASTHLPAAKMRKLVDGSRHAVTPLSNTLDLSQFVRQSPSRKHITFRSDVVDTINASDVAIKLNYDPATIARDVLIVADRHPTEKSLNHHLQVLRQNFYVVNYKSDLATFRWDMVDPWVHYPPEVEKVFSRIENNQTSTISTTRPDSISQPQTLSNPPNLPNVVAQAVPAGPPSSEEPHMYARDFSSAPLARPAESRPVYNIYNTVPGTTSIGTTSTGTTATTYTNTTNSVTAGAGSQSVRWERTPGTEVDTTRFGTIGPVPTVAHAVQTGATNHHPVRPNYLAQSTSSAISSTSSPAPTAHKSIPTPPSAVKLNAFGALPFKPSSYYSRLRLTGQPLPYSLPSLPPPSSSQESSPPVSVESPALSQAAPAACVSVPKSPEKSKTVPSASPLKSAGTSSLPQTFQTASDSPRGKHSRKSSLPKGLPEPQVVIPVSPEVMSLIKRKPGRPPKATVQVEVAIDNRPAPQYQVFHCKWTKCEAELHSLQAIQSHIVGVHIPHHITCAWEGCTDQTPRAAAAMWDHVYKDHVSPLAWKLGDGPAASVTVANGNESVETFGHGRHDIMTLPADRDLVKIFSRTHGTQTPKQKAQLMFEGGRRWKDDAGPELDASDRELSNPTRLLASSHTETAYTVSEVRVVI